MGNGHIFISYRREDSAGYARAISDQLVERFSKDRVFMDVDAIEPGLPFDEAIQKAVGGCEVLLALIGPRWMQPQGSSAPRINESKDYVRAEIAAALARNVRVIPVLLDGATMPPEDRLPEPLRPLARRNAIEISHSRFDSDVQRLMDSIAKRDRPRKAGLLWLAGALALLLIGFVAVTQLRPKGGVVADTTNPAGGLTPGAGPRALGQADSQSAGQAAGGPVERGPGPIELADLVAGTYDGGVVADAQGPSRSDVTVTIAKLNKRRVRITSDYERLGTVEVELTRVGATVMSAGGSVVLLVYLDKTPPQISYNPGGVAYGGQKR